jgi:LAO/AO transport system kinase
VSDLPARVLSGDTRAAARLCRLVDDRAEGYRDLLRALGRAATPATIVGVTGSPGAGKSTLVDRLVAGYRSSGDKVGVVAVDPTSPFTGGAILGDRIRMQRHFEDDGVFIRSVATRGALGGLSRSVRDVARVLEAWGARVVLIETVGVGQDELDVTLVAGTTIVVVAPGQGDDVQAIKAGILEVADVFAVNKADRPGADATVRDLENMLALGAISLAAVATASHSTARAKTVSGATASGWTPPVVRTVATTGDGVTELLAGVRDHGAFQEGEMGRALALGRTRRLVESVLRDALSEAALAELHDDVDVAADRVARRETDLDDEIERLAAAFRA